MRIPGMFVWALVFALTGCGKSDIDNPAGHIKRGKERLVNQNDLNQLALLCFQYYQDQAPADLQQLKSMIQKDAPNIYRKIDQGQIVLLHHKKITSDMVIAYEKEPDLNGKQLAAMGDGKSVNSMTAAELQKALQVKE